MERFIKNQIIQVSAAIERGQIDEVKSFISFAKKWHGSHFEAAAMICSAHLVSIGEMEKAKPKRRKPSRPHATSAPASLPPIASLSARLSTNKVDSCP